LREAWEIARRRGKGEVEERERGGFGVVESSRVLCEARSVGGMDGGDEGLRAELTVQILWPRQDVDGEDEHSDKTPKTESRVTLLELFFLREHTTLLIHIT
jgi:hypothetical protein